MIHEAVRVIHQVKASIAQSLIGMERAVEELLMAVMAGGHILLEDVPGVGKTALAKAFARELGLSFRRIQCTPDLLPSDILGGLVYHPRTGEFTLRKGPIFAHVLLVDEINRALPRTQSALLEAMAEGQVTIDGETHVLPQPFFVMATQNPVESQGVFPLPEAQLDRFLFKTSLGYPPAEAEVALLRLHLADGPAAAAELSAEVTRPNGINSATTPTRAESGPVPDQTAAAAADVPPRWAVLWAAVRQVRTSDDVLRYMADVVRATREHPDVQIGASPRALIMLAHAARAAAVIAGRSFVTPDDVQRVAPLVLFHRLVFHGAPDQHPHAAWQWTRELLATVPVPVDDAAAGWTP
ncbi:putative regulatory protein [Alicyclobacillus cellulosilyticus]|uniref:Regulatory protein n=1 Tax=Alicyclobacillus cellulosilyticus TaxID=1003997 RepID=A0A917KB59_9BACL|nr:MoxR family ATPase [Alicyclobacillus cellulosilyticus]GGJ06901.1 putative regulatory protein [Alicyclobacillus cellulosilyticus]